MDFSLTRGSTLTASPSSAASVSAPFPRSRTQPIPPVSQPLLLPPLQLESATNDGFQTTTSQQRTGVCSKPMSASSAVAYLPCDPSYAACFPPASALQTVLFRRRHTRSRRGPERIRTRGSRRASPTSSPSSSDRTSRIRLSWSTATTCSIPTIKAGNGIGFLRLGEKNSRDDYDMLAHHLNNDDTI